MFALVLASSKYYRTRMISVVGSIAAHLVVMAVLLWQPTGLIKPRVVMKGNRGSSTVLVYLPSETATPRQPDSQAHSPLHIRRQTKRQITAVNKAPVSPQESAGSATPTTLTGTSYGSQSQGLTFGPE